MLAAAGAMSLIGLRPRPVVWNLPRGRTLIADVVAALFGWTLAGSAGFTGMVPIAAAALAAAIPAARRRRSRERDLRRESGRWPDFLAAVRSRLATGVAIPAACAEAGRMLGGRFLHLVGPPGRSFADTLAAARAVWADPLADRVLTTLEVANVVGGGHVGTVLGALTASVNDDLRLRRAHDAALTEQRLTAGVALLAPWVILALSMATNPTAAEAFDTRTGNSIVAGGLAATVVGYLLARRSAQLSRPPRLFA